MEAQRVLAGADRLYGADAVRAAYDRMAAAIEARFQGGDLLLYAVMLGGLIPAAEIAARTRLPLRLGYIHATRYREALRGGALKWQGMAGPAMAGRRVLVVDDILDEGLTLAAILREVRDQGPAEVYTAVLVDKDKAGEKPVQADFVGLTVPDRYVFGCGMDYKGYWRNLPEIYAVAETA